MIVIRIYFPDGPSITYQDVPGPLFFDGNRITFQSKNGEWIDTTLPYLIERKEAKKD